MTLPGTTRRHAAAITAAVCALVLGGLGWATWSAVELDRVRARETWSQSVDEVRALALSRLDALMAPLLYRESARPYNHFRRYYKPTGVLLASDRSAVEESVILESPLKSAARPDWLLLYFQATEAGGEPIWSSPQLEDEGEQVLSAAAIPPAARGHLAGPENWLAALRDRYTPSYLLNELERAITARGESRKSLSQAAGAGPGPQRQRDQVTSDAPSPAPLPSRTAAEFTRRGARLLQMEIESNVELCVPETVALENLEAGAKLAKTTRQTAECVPVWLTSMTPLWLDLTRDGQPDLAFLRSVVVQGNAYCTLQGVLIDWKRLREVLETEVRDLFPHAVLAPVETATLAAPGAAHSMMQTIPARLLSGEPAAGPRAGVSAGLKVGLTVAWVATILALAAISYGVIKYVALTERRMRFVAAVTHELRTPLTSFQLYTDLLADMKEDDRAARRHYVETLRRESKRLARLVENVLAYSRLEDSKQSLRPRRTTPSELLTTVSAAMSDQCAASGKNLVIEDRCRPGLEFETDPEYAVQILTNLVENSCKYSAGAADPRISLTAAQADEGAVVFEVDDAGPGVASQDRRRIFEPFQRGDSLGSGGPAAMGLGLGLALSRYWASCLGGQLSLRRSSGSSSRYSCFALRLPLVKP